MKSYIKKFVDDVLLANGISVMVPEDENQNYGFFFVDGQMLYFQEDYFQGNITFSSCHRPSPRVGTGFSIIDPYNGLPADSISFEYVLKLPEMLNRIWGHHEHKPLGYYNSFEDYLKKNTILKYKILEAK